MPAPTTATHCLRYWDLADHIRIDDAIALWCGVEPVELAKLNVETQCMSAKRPALGTALRDERLGDEVLGLLTGQSKVFRGAPVDELIEKGPRVINKASLRRWFEQRPFDDRPAFLFAEKRQPVLPDGSDVAEMTGLKRDGTGRESSVYVMATVTVHEYDPAMATQALRGVLPCSKRRATRPVLQLDRRSEGGWPSLH